ncbi:Hsp70 family protein [Streptomyces sp. JNUCC 64]
MGQEEGSYPFDTNTPGGRSSMIVSVDIGASTTKAAVLGTDPPELTTVRVEGVPEWPTALLLDRKGALITGVGAVNRREAAPFRGRYLAGLKQRINLPSDIEPAHRELHFPAGPTRPLVRGVRAVITHTLRAVAERHGAPLRLVLTHPVIWSDAEKAVLAEAATAARWPSATLVSEAEAVGAHAALRHGLEGPFAVLDFGASTFDFALLDPREDGLPEVVYQTGRLIGGDDFDTAVLTLVRNALPEEGRRALRELGRARPEVLREEAELVKRALTTRKEARFALGDLDLPVHRDDFTDAVEPLVARCLTAAREALTALEGTVRPRTLVLSGGAARVPKVREQVEGLADSCGAELVDLVEGVDGSPVALGATRFAVPSRQGRLPRPARTFTLDRAAIRLGDTGATVAGVPGGVAELPPGGPLRLRRGTDGTAPESDAAAPAPEASRMPVARIAADPVAPRLLLASPSPAFLVTTVDPAADRLDGGVVFGRFAASRGGPDGPVSALACRGPLVAWTEPDGRGACVDTRSWEWHPLPLEGPVSELMFTDAPWLLARVPGRLLLIDVLTGRQSAELELPDDVTLAVEPRAGTVCVADGEAVTAHDTRPGRFALRWRRPLRSPGTLAFTHTGAEAAVVAFDAESSVYRALRAGNGEQFALRDALGFQRPTALLPSPDPGVVYARTRAGLDRLHLGAVTS